jgi:hypothetical protein
MQIFGQYIINQYFLQNTVEIICQEIVFFYEKETTREKKIWQPAKIWLVSIYKLGFLFKIKAGPSFNPQTYSKYFEELKLGPNTEIGAKDFFEMVSSLECISLD